MEWSSRKTATYFAILDVSYWGILAAYASFFAAFSLHLGYKEAIVSPMIAVYYLCNFAGQLVFGPMSDKLRSNKKVFLFCIISGGISQLFMYFTNPYIVPYLIGFGLTGFFFGPMGAMVDTWMIKSLRYDMTLYGKSRSIGAVGYSLSILIMGKAIAAIGYFIMPIVATILVVTTLALGLRIPDAPVMEENASKGITIKDIAGAIKVPVFAVLLLCLFFCGLALSPAGNLKILILQNVGGDVGNQGVDACIGCMSQFFIFYFAGRIAKISWKYRITIGALFVIGSQFIFFSAGSIWMIYCGSFLSYGVMSMINPASREMIKEYMPYEYQTTANGLVDACYTALSATISLLFAGMIAGYGGIHFLVSITLSLGVMPLLLTFVIIYMCRKKK